MKQIDLEPKEYRAQPIKGEPVLIPGAARRVAFNTVVAVVSIAVGYTLLGAVNLAESWFPTLWS